ncbi:CBS domain-containing protein [Neobacillus mesonae]|nr:CBS domain-containing protein [Neobacillus mesonae]
MELSSRQQEIIDLVSHHAPITGDHIAELLGLSRPTIRSDLSLLVMLGLLDAKPKVGYTLGTASNEVSPLHEQISRLTVGDVLTPPILIEAHRSAYDAVAMLFQENTGTLFVVNDNKDFVGIVSRKDLLKITLGHADLRTIPVSMAMTRRAQSVALTPHDPVTHAAKMLIRYQVNCLPVIRGEVEPSDAEHEVIGRVSKTNLLHLFIELAGV